MQFGQSGTIYDSPPAQSIIFKVGAPDLNLPLGGGFQAAHIWVNNQSNQSLWLPGAPDVVPPGVTRVVAIQTTDVAQASWTIPAQFAITQAATPTGAAILIWLHGGIDIQATPGIANQPVVIQPQTLLATIPVTNSSSKDIAVPAGSHVIGIAVASADSLAALKVTGKQSGVNYWPGPGLNSATVPASSFLLISILSALDTTITVTWTFNVSNTTIWVVGILDTEAVMIFPSAVKNQPGYAGVELYSSALPTSSALIGQQVAGLSLPVVQASNSAVTTAPGDGAKATYSGSAGFTPAANPTDVFAVFGAAGKTIRVLRVTVEGTQTTGGVVNLSLIKRSAVNTGGTSASANITPHDSTDPAASATAVAYTVNPTALGAAVGAPRAARAFIPAVTGQPDRVVWDFGTRPGKAIVLRGVAQGLVLNLAGVAVAGLACVVTVEWTEE